MVGDYATRYPEAIPLRSTDAIHVAEELIKVFARVGVPEEILTDQGSNFTSQLLAELYCQDHWTSYGSHGSPVRRVMTVSSPMSSQHMKSY